MESREKYKTALSAKFTLSDCNPDGNPATKMSLCGYRLSPSSIAASG